MLTVGTYLADRYEIVSKIGAGGMSDVYKAKDHVLGRFVAIKVLKPEFSVEPMLVPVNTVPSSSIKKAFILCPAFLASWQKKRENLFFLP